MALRFIKKGARTWQLKFAVDVTVQYARTEHALIARTAQNVAMRERCITENVTRTTNLNMEIQKMKIKNIRDAGCHRKATQTRLAHQP